MAHYLPTYPCESPSLVSGAWSKCAHCIYSGHIAGGVTKHRCWMGVKSSKALPREVWGVEREGVFKDRTSLESMLAAVRLLLSILTLFALAHSEGREMQAKRSEVKEREELRRGWAFWSDEWEDAGESLYLKWIPNNCVTPLLGYSPPLLVCSSESRLSQFCLLANCRQTRQ